MQVVRDDNTVPIAAEAPWSAIFKVDRPHLAMRPGKRRQSADTNVDGGYRKPHINEQPGMTPATGGEVENAAAALD
jgi:hypothetical protein